MACIDAERFKQCVVSDGSGPCSDHQWRRQSTISTALSTLKRAGERGIYYPPLFGFPKAGFPKGWKKSKALLIPESLLVSTEWFNVPLIVAQQAYVCSPEELDPRLGSSTV